uniref:zinc finger MYM-type protein 6-like n=1 Tax=Styela clava TaxID=7725 RepID=UPI001939EC52|nr:zinc finger MYM-type protein 6-like [Styela clava]
MEQQVVEEVKKSPCFSIQLDESTDLSNCAILLCFVRYKGITDFKEELLCCISLSGRTTKAEIFRFLDAYITAKGIDWGIGVGVCTNGATSMTGCRSEMVTKIKEVAHEKMLYTHCIIHREHLASKKPSPELKNVMNNAVKIVNAIKTRPLNSMDSQHQHLLFHAEVRWLSRGRVLTRLFNLRGETKLFLIEISFPLAEFMTDETWLFKLAYLADIFGRLNELNTSLQDACTNIFVLRNKTDAFKKKLAMWNSYVLEENIVMFLTLNDYIYVKC